MSAAALPSGKGRNLSLSTRKMQTAPKTIRERLSLYLSEQARRHGGNRFTIPYSRQQLADYLSVDRSALSNELSKMQQDDLIRFHRSDFTLLKELVNTVSLRILTRVLFLQMGQSSHIFLFTSNCS